MIVALTCHRPSEYVQYSCTKIVFLPRRLNIQENQHFIQNQLVVHLPLESPFVLIPLVYQTLAYFLRRLRCSIYIQHGDAATARLARTLDHDEWTTTDNTRYTPGDHRQNECRVCDLYDTPSSCIRSHPSCRLSSLELLIVSQSVLLRHVNRAREGIMCQRKYKKNRRMHDLEMNCTF